MRKTIFVTGGAGFIGSALIRHLISETFHRIVNVDKLTYAGNLESLPEKPPSERYQFIREDIKNRREITEIIFKVNPDYIIHLAAESHVDRSIDGPSEFLETNILGTFNLLEAAKEYYQTLDREKQDSFRFHNVSTDEVYGDLDAGADSFTEHTPYQPSSPYSATKAGGDHLVRAWGRTYGLPVIVTNCSNNYGPHQFPEKLIPHVILNALNARPLPLYGDGLQIRDWLYVNDHARALREIMDHGEVGQTYNIGGHNEKTNLEVVETICDLLEELGVDYAPCCEVEQRT